MRAEIMKYYLMCLLTGMCLFTVFELSAQSYKPYTFNKAVYYDGRLVRGADIATFRDLGFGYGKDRNHVYRHGEVLEFVDPHSFRVDERFAAKRQDGGEKAYYVSKFEVFYNGVKIPGAVAASFRILEGGYAKDAFCVYWKGEKVSGAVSSSFVYLGWGYAKDTFCVYWKGEKVKGAVPSSFRVTRDGYAEDTFNTYYRGNKVD